MNGWMMLPADESDRFKYRTSCGAVSVCVESEWAARDVITTPGHISFFINWRIYICINLIIIKK